MYTTFGFTFSLVVSLPVILFVDKDFSAMLSRQGIKLWLKKAEAHQHKFTFYDVFVI